MVKIAPSLLSADFSRLGEEVVDATQAGADIIHFDVMDGHFVPNITFGPMVLRAIRRFSRLPFEAHLMIVHPRHYWRQFADAGADMIGVHVEGDFDREALIHDIRSSGRKTCLVFNPATAFEKGIAFLESVDQVLAMTVNPGFGGQDFIYEVLPKIEALASFREKRGLAFPVEVDGGINAETARLVKDAGADILVAGSFIFGSDDYRRVIGELRCA